MKRGEAVAIAFLAPSAGVAKLAVIRGTKTLVGTWPPVGARSR